MSALLDRQPPIERAAEPEALIEQARRRQRRRRRASGLVAALAIAGVGIYAAACDGGPSAPPDSVAASADRAGYPSVDPRAFRAEGDLAFVSLGSLFVLDGATGALRQVPPLTGAASDPQFSPDGRWLAFQTGDNAVGVARADGASPRLLAQQSFVGWLPDGELLTTFTGTSTSTAPAPLLRYRISSAGRPVRVGTASADLMSWSPDGHAYVFDVSSAVVTNPNGGSHATASIEVASSLSGKRTVWNTIRLTGVGTSVSGNFAQRIDVLPAGEGLLVWTDPGHFDDADGSSVYLIRSPGARMRQLGITVGDTLSVGPRGVIALDVGIGRLAWKDKMVETCRLSTARCTAVPTPRGDVSVDPSWSPGGTELAYVEARAFNTWGFPQATISAWYATRRLWVLRAPSTHPVEVAGTRGAASPVWSADGKALMFVKNDALWLVHGAGTRDATKPVRIASPLFIPSWPSYYGQVAWGSQFAWSGASPLGS
jgi:TolB protein